MKGPKFLKSRRGQIMAVGGAGALLALVAIARSKKQPAAEVVQQNVPVPMSDPFAQSYVATGAGGGFAGGLGVPDGWVESQNQTMLAITDAITQQIETLTDRIDNLASAGSGGAGGSGGASTGGGGGASGGDGGASTGGGMNGSGSAGGSGTVQVTGSTMNGNGTAFAATVSGSSATTNAGNGAGGTAPKRPADTYTGPTGFFKAPGSPTGWRYINEYGLVENSGKPGANNKQIANPLTSGAWSMAKAEQVRQQWAAFHAAGGK